MYSRKKAGQRMEPWRNPALAWYSCEDFPSRTTWSRLSLRKGEIRPNFSQFNKNLDWCAENNVRRACLARKARHENLPISRDSHVNKVRCAPLHDTWTYDICMPFFSVTAPLENKFSLPFMFRNVTGQLSLQ